tara:strand:- start:372 stop:1034 length:663 start_codon:yes stop_codon:yes gene_type:complete
MVSAKEKAKRVQGLRGSRVKRFSRFTGLSCFDEFEAKISYGYTNHAIATWLQDEKGKCKDVKPRSLATMVGRYRKALPPMKRGIKPDVRGQVQEKALKEVEKSIDELKEVSKLYRIQMDRVSEGVEQEAEIRGLVKTLGQEINLAASLLRQSHAIKMDLGLDGGRDLGTVTVRPEVLLSVKENHGDSVYSAISSPQSRGKVLAIAKQLMLASKADEVVDV